MDVRGRLAELTASGGRADAERLHDMFTLMWDWSMLQSPEAATQIGYPGLNDRWSDRSPENIAETKALAPVWADAVASIDRDALDPADQLNLDLFRRHVAMGVEATRFHDDLLPVGPVFGPHTMAAQILAMMPASTEQGRADIRARLAGLAPSLDQIEQLMRDGLEQGYTMPRAIMSGVPDQIAAQVVDPPSSSPLLQAYRTAGLGEDSPELRDAASIVEDVVLPAFRRFGEFVSDTYIPGCRDTIGIDALPDGQEWYAHKVRVFTTTSLTPKEIHEIGLSECERILAEMRQVQEQLGFEDRAELLRSLNEDDRYFFDTDDELLATYRDICKRIDPTLPSLFRTLPRLPYGVIPVPPYMAERAPTAFYQPGAAELGRAGMFFANTFDLRSRPKWEMEALTLHEAVPGHHLQVALAQEMGHVPEFRKHGGFTAYIEGWGLYAEHLGTELGFYADPSSRFGQLSYEMWRAGRLVVDTGMHALGWERQRAIDFLIEHTGKTSHDIEVEVDRYISWPGQALAYKIGELRIKELRARATERLGERFDVRAFHDEVLREGALPLDVLEERIDGWIAAV